MDLRLPVFAELHLVGNSSEIPLNLLDIQYMQGHMTPGRSSTDGGHSATNCQGQECPPSLYDFHDYVIGGEDMKKFTSMSSVKV